MAVTNSSIKWFDSSYSSNGERAWLLAKPSITLFRLTDYNFFFSLKQKDTLIVPGQLPRSTEQNSRKQIDTPPLPQARSQLIKFAPQSKTWLTNN